MLIGCRGGGLTGQGARGRLIRIVTHQGCIIDLNAFFFLSRVWIKQMVWLFTLAYLHCVLHTLLLMYAKQWGGCFVHWHLWSVGSCCKSLYTFSLPCRLALFIPKLRISAAHTWNGWCAVSFFVWGFYNPRMLVGPQRASCTTIQGGKAISGDLWS